MTSTVPGTVPIHQARAGRVPLTPGRMAALVVAVPVVLVLIAGYAFSLLSDFAKGSFPVNFTVPAKAGTLSMSFNGGDVSVRGATSATDVARVTGTVFYSFTPPTVRHTAGDISLDCHFGGWGNCGMNAIVSVPPQATLNVSTGGGDVSASGLTGTDRLSTDGGNLTVSYATGDLTMTTGGGDVRADHVSGATVSLDTDGGNISGSAMTSPDVIASTGGGDITLTFTSVPRDLHVTTDGGNITITVPPAPGTHGGYIVTKTTDGGNLGGNLQSTPGATNLITAHSGGGDITVNES
jgi:hypothetical protein